MTKRQKRKQAALVAVPRRRFRPQFGEALFGVRQKIKLNYSDLETLDPPIAGIDTRVFSMNNLYDPNVSGTGHQPRGYDQVTLLYDHWVVIGCKITVIFTGDTSTSSDNYICGIAMRDTNSASIGIYDYTESRNVIFKSVSAQNNYPTTISMNANPNKFLSISHPLSNSTVKGSVTNPPSEQGYWHIFAHADDAGTNPPVLSIFVQLEYTAIFFEPKQPGQS